MMSKKTSYTIKRCYYSQLPNEYVVTEIDQDLDCADLNCDGRVTSVDALMILQEASK